MLYYIKKILTNISFIFHSKQRNKFSSINSICVFGDFKRDYIRNDVIIEGLMSTEVEISICHTNKKGILRIIDLFIKYGKTQKKQIILVASSDTSRLLVLLISIISRRFIIWDAHYSLYDSWINDRKLAKKISFKGFYYWCWDWVACQTADIILLDTYSHIDYFVKEFNIDRSKFIRVLVGANEELLKSGIVNNSDLIEKINRDNEGKFIVNFHGKFIPLQGVEFIMEAAKILEDEKDIIFNIIGSGQTYNEVRTLAKKLNLPNVTFFDRVSYDKIPAYLSSSDVSLGIFGITDKAYRVIANKIYESLALGVPVITADTPASRETFTDGENVIFCQSGSGKDLALKIKFLRDNKDIKCKIGKSGYDLFTEICSVQKIGSTLLKDLQFYYIKKYD